MYPSFEEIPPHLHSILFLSPNAGDGDEDYMTLALKDGGIAVSISLGNGVLNTGIKPDGISFNDSQWHNVVVTRIVREVRWE